jgi:EXLDI family protein
MPNKTIYVSENDASLFDEAKTLAGEALSSVIVRALREFVARNRDKKKGMKEIIVTVGKDGSEREQRFVGSWIGEWSGFSDTKEWYQKATIYHTQKDNWAVVLETVYKATLLTNRKEWQESGDYLINPKRCDLLVGKSAEELKDALPEDLYHTLQEYAKHDESAIEYLDI